MDFDEFYDFLMSQNVNKIDLGLTKINELMEKLGNPHLGGLANNGKSNYKPKYIHVAGTNGKGSTCAMLAYCLSQKYKVGLFTSPHLVNYTERIQTLGYDNPGELKQISKEKVLEIFQKIKPHLNGQSYYEITTAIAFMYFYEIQPDITILEVGLGGRLDATNIIDPEVSVITTLDIDHKDFLGDTIELIAKEKCGIIKKNKPVVISKSNGERNNVLQIIEGYCKNSNSKLIIAKKYQGSLALIGEHQKENSAVVIETLNLLDEFKLTKEEIQNGLKSTKWPARLEWRKSIKPNECDILIDSAHNVSGMKKLVEYIKRIKNTKKYNIINILTGILSTKEYEKMIELLNQISDNIIITSIPDRKFTSPDTLLQYAKNGVIIEDPFLALKSAKELTFENDLLIITGSLYLIGLLYEEI